VKSTRLQPVFLALVALGFGAGTWVSQGPIAGDVAVTIALQELLGASPGWAVWLTRTAAQAGIWLLVLLCCALAWLRCRDFCALAPLLAVVAAKGADALLRAVLFVPRPSPELVDVAAISGSSGLPSTFGLMYGAALGGVAFVRGPYPRTTITVLEWTAFSACTARVVLGAHWPSQMFASAALGLLIACCVVALMQHASDR
jgi:membrane-associated phospholipid phosphatase